MGQSFKPCTLFQLPSMKLTFNQKTAMEKLVYKDDKPALDKYT